MCMCGCMRACIYNKNYVSIVVVNTAGCYSYMSCAGHREHILRLLDPEQTTWQINKQTHSFVQVGAAFNKRMTY